MAATRVEDTRKAWTRLVETGRLEASLVRPHVRQAWRRCVAEGADRHAAMLGDADGVVLDVVGHEASVHETSPDGGLPVEPARNEYRIFVSALPPSSSSAAARTEPDAPEPRTRRTVLVADDDADLREVVVDLLRDEGWRVLEAVDGEQALRLTVSERPDVLVLDHRMPRLEGVEVLRHLRAQGVEVPVVFVTAASELEGITGSLGAERHLSKPFDLDVLAEAVVQAARGGRPAT